MFTVSAVLQSVRRCSASGAARLVLINNLNISDCVLPSYLVPLCMCLNSRDSWIQSSLHLLVLLAGNPYHADQDLSVCQPSHLLLDEPPVPEGVLGKMWPVTGKVRELGH